MLTSEEIVEKKLTERLACKGAQIRRRRQQQEIARDMDQRIEPASIRTLEYLARTGCSDSIALKKSLRIHETVFKRNISFLETHHLVSCQDRLITVSDKGHKYLADRERLKGVKF